ncbi:unnamed protein product [Phytomonas sp. EM1]|nr:unnamed protein product [Phytomonas sp. EM1]|eukprot:CCW62079.1 unnamed protein product [Phytomonas sp. isolate EM1]
MRYSWGLPAFRRVRSSAPLSTLAAFAGLRFRSTPPAVLTEGGGRVGGISRTRVAATAWAAPTPGLFRSTRGNLFLPPPLARLLVVAGLAVGQAFLLAFHNERQRLRREEAEAASEGTPSSSSSSSEGGRQGGGSHPNRPPMTSLEALQILGIHPTPSSPANPAGLPLTTPSERELARRNFERMFAVAQKHENWFLAGKLSAAYRMCVDPTWDHPAGEGKESNGDDLSKEGGGGSS